ncbi:hypothetical protein BOA8489_03971 [Boseongicola aestuarii]|uniref:Uncharacterized protein n=1 Tax=Boseongicola aestuarii TaxID=1470561 RepID=A0A238J595_9RHOB|nr:hypothetical protein BOA8489_03971 [Boseongicola aestuarii]
MMRERLLSGISHRNWPEFREFAEVMDGGGEMELVLGAVGSSEAMAVVLGLTKASRNRSMTPNAHFLRGTVQTS